MDDSALAVALAQRDPRALDEVYRRYADRLYAFACSLVGDRDAAADIVQDTFLLASEHAGQLRDPARLRPWLYAIARHAGMRRLRSQAKLYPVPHEAFDDQPSEVADPLTGLRSAEIAELVWAAYAGLPPGDREITELSVRHGLSTTDIAGMLDISVKHVNARLSRARASLAECLGVLVVARAGSSCATLSDLLAGWDGKLTPSLRLRLQRHIEKCIICGEVRRRRMNPAAVLAGYASAPFALAPMLLGERAGPPPASPRWDRASGLPAGAWRPNRTMAITAGALLAVLCAIAATGVWPGGELLGGTQPASSPVPAGTGPDQPGVANPSPSSAPSDPAPSPEPSPSPAAEPSPQVSTAPPQHKPVATITKPSGNVTFLISTATRNVQFAGNATDAEDGSVPGTRYRWTARNGTTTKALCVGSAVPGTGSGGIVTYKHCASFTAKLGPSTWTVTVEAFDSTGRVGTDSVEVEIIYIAG